MSNGGSSVRWFSWLVAPLLASGVQVASAQGAPKAELESKGSQPFEEKGYALEFDNMTDTLTKETAKNLRKAFFETYPLECETFNPSCADSVTIRVEPNDIPCGKDEEGNDILAAACATGTLIQISAPHMADHPQDYDLVTHEAMHVVQQGYQDTSDCVHWHEGLADVARSRFGINNKAQGWKLVKGKSYTDGYVQTAHFLEWVEEKYTVPVAVDLDAELRATGCPTDTFWQGLTTLGVDELWKVYDTGAATPPSSDAEPIGRNGAVEPSDPADEDAADPVEGGEETEAGDDSWDTEAGDDSWDTEAGDDSWDTEAGDDSWDTEEGGDSWDTEEGDDSWSTDESDSDDTSDDEEFEEGLGV